ncbi:MAG: DUF6680 family protein [Pseudomonadota bacterium]
MNKNEAFARVIIDALLIDQSRDTTNPNAVPIEVYDNDEKLKAIVDKWKAYLNHLGQKSMAIEVWGPKRLELFVDLLHEMVGFLGDKFNSVEISNGIYSPEGHAKIETDQEMIRRGSLCS